MAQELVLILGASFGAHFGSKSLCSFGSKSWCSFWEQVFVLILGASVCAHLGARVGAHFGSKSCLILMADNNKLALIQTE